MTRLEIMPVWSHQPVVSDSSVRARGTCTRLCFWVVCLLCWSFLPAESLGSVGGASPPEQRFKRRRTWSGSDSSQTENNEQEEGGGGWGAGELPSEEVPPDLFLFKMYRNMFLSASATKSVKKKILCRFEASGYFKWCVNAPKRVQPACD